MNTQLFVNQGRTARQTARDSNADWSRLPPSGAGRLLAAFAIIGLLVGLFDSAPRATDTPAASSYDSSQQGR